MRSLSNAHRGLDAQRGETQVRIFEQSICVPGAPAHRDLLTHLARAVQVKLSNQALPCRLAITASRADRYECEIGVIKGLRLVHDGEQESIFRFCRRSVENTDRFIAVLLVPTGIGAEIGGHAGDAAPVAKLMANACDLLVTHPNVVNASDINEIPENALYVEGSVLTRLLMGTAGLQPVRSNRVIMVMDAHRSDALADAAINAVNGARAAYGLDCPKVVKLEPPLSMRSEYTASGRAAGQIAGFERLLEVLEGERRSYDAVAISSGIQVPPEFHQRYFNRQGDMVNPWGGVEALLTHAISEILTVPSAHSPMFESEEVANANPGIVEPRMAAEAVSVTFLQCILKGLQRSPRIVTGDAAMRARSIVTAEDVCCMIIPDGCLGLPTLAALEQGISVIAVRENQNLMRNDLSALPWAPGQFYVVENYWEAVGVMTAIRAGLPPQSVRRPLGVVNVETHGSKSARPNATASARPLEVESDTQLREFR